MIEIKTNLGTTEIKCIGMGVILLAEAGSIVDELYSTFKERMGKNIADAFANTAMQQLANLKENRSIDGTPFEDKDEGECSKPEEKREPGEAGLSAAKCKLEAVMDAITALEKLKALIDKSKKED
jgi:hypothetical protein